MSNRREFVKRVVIGGAGLALYGGFTDRAWGFYQTTPQSTPKTGIRKVTLSVLVGPTCTIR